MKIIDAVARQKGGNGIPASTLDTELSYMFRNGQKREKKRSQKVQDVSDNWQP